MIGGRTRGKSQRCLKRVALDDCRCSADYVLQGRCRCSGFIGRYYSCRIASVTNDCQRRRQGHHIAWQISDDRESRTQRCLGRPAVRPCVHVQTAQCTRILFDSIESTVCRCRQKRGDRPRANAVTMTRARETVNQRGEATRGNAIHSKSSASIRCCRARGI